MTFWAHLTKVTFEVKTAEATYFWQRLVKIGLLFSLTFYHTARSLHLHFKATTKQSLITEMNERAENESREQFFTRSNLCQTWPML